ncbi:hypothetical protein GCM10011446_25880 [Acinetobacter vivianii]|nr:hypothetical protein GCM10011446_25880 [Acinetobacter vivianii]
MDKFGFIHSIQQNAQKYEIKHKFSDIPSLIFNMPYTEFSPEQAQYRLITLMIKE